jgi:hypothetical protein
MNKKNIIWLASYPKSGNTWFRSFLSALFNEVPFDINDLTEGHIFSRKSVFEEVLDIDTALFTNQELTLLHPKVYEYLSNVEDKNLYFKIHDAIISNETNYTNVPFEVSKCAIYFVRNPLDVVISFANHNSSTIDRTIDIINESNYNLGHESGKQLFQPLLNWSEHYTSWTTKPNFPVYVLRYEDMLEDTFRVFKDIVQKIGLKYSDEAIQMAIDATSFEKLKKQEEENGFREKNPDSPRFFNNGTSGTWKGKLTQVQIDKIVESQGEVMRKLGYL